MTKLATLATTLGAATLCALGCDARVHLACADNSECDGRAACVAGECLEQSDVDDRDASDASLVLRPIPIVHRLPDVDAGGGGGVDSGVGVDPLHPIDPPAEGEGTVAIGEGEGEGSIVVDTPIVDEDLDGVADDDDDCPGILDGDQNDVDGDGVGDACDPRPTLGGDALVLFDGFNDGTAPADPDWFVVGEGDWFVDGGQLRQTSTSATNDTHVIFHVGETDVVVETHVTLESTTCSTPAMNLFAGVRVEDDAGELGGYTCSGRTNGAANTVRLAQHAGFELLDDSSVPPIADGSAHTLKAGASGDELQCGWDGAPAFGLASTSFTQSKASLGTQCATASFDYIAVYAVAGALE